MRLAPPWPMISIRWTIRSAVPPQSFIFSACSRSGRSTRPKIEQRTDESRGNAFYQLDREWRTRHALGPGAAASGRLPAYGPRPDRIAYWLRARRLRRLFGPGRWGGGSRLPHAGGAGRRLRRGHDRGPDRIRGDRRLAGEIRRSQRIAV